jgi:hypothetical protein
MERTRLHRTGLRIIMENSQGRSRRERRKYRDLQGMLHVGKGNRIYSAFDFSNHLYCV